jgi:hypothetical protein
MVFGKKDLEAQDYFWDENALYKGEPTRRVFDRHNGNQVLFLINHYGSLTGTLSLEEGRAIESWLRNQLPMASMSEVSVSRWISHTAAVSP